MKEEINMKKVWEREIYRQEEKSKSEWEREWEIKRYMNVCYQLKRGTYTFNLSAKRGKGNMRQCN